MAAPALASHEMNMLMIARTSFFLVSGYVGAVGDEPGGLQHGTNLEANSAGPQHHAKLTHMRQHLTNIALRLKGGDAIQVPARGKPRMSLHEVAAFDALMVVHVDTTFKIALGLLHALLELGEPRLRVLVHVLVQLLQPGEQRAGR